jgi:putative protein kinase ArgK-like GTPase of G3E family
MREYDLASSMQLLDEMAKAVDRLRSAPRDSEVWRETVIESSAVLSRGVADLMTALNKPTGDPEAHLKAQRFARVKAAEIRLYQASQVRSGRVAGDLYGALKSHIDAARQAFREQFMTPMHGIPDYVHIELVKTLANDDVVQLGPKYPGPMA